MTLQAYVYWNSYWHSFDSYECAIQSHMIIIIYSCLQHFKERERKHLLTLRELKGGTKKESNKKRHVQVSNNLPKKPPTCDYCGEDDHHEDQCPHRDNVRMDDGEDEDDEASDDADSGAEHSTVYSDEDF